MSSSREHSMGRGSGFAQKLLDDLKLRKERLAVSQSSNNANFTSADKLAYSRRTFKGSKVEIQTQNTGFRSGNIQNRHSAGNTSLTKGEASNQIVPFGRGQSSEKIDLSTALAFALENVGKATRADPSGSASILSFLHQIGRRSMDYGKMEIRSGVERHRPSVSQLPMIHLHIKEISKGTQKLNQIIKASTNGLTFNTYSIEYGKELMKGAIDLEQSLRMLVEIQEASNYMISHPQRKNRIKLLEDDEDEDDDTVERNEQKQLGLPRFSFDQASRNHQDIQEYARADIKMRLAALAYHPTEANINNGKQTPAPSRESSHRRSISYSPDGKSLSRFSEQNFQGSFLQPKAGKGRIPNVIAKLMGLGELPEERDFKYNKQKDSTLKTKPEEPVSSKTKVSGTKKIEQSRKDSELASQNIKQKVAQANKVAALENLVALQEGKKLTSKNVTMDGVIHDEARTWKQLNSATRNQNDNWEKERKHNSVNHTNREGEKKGETKELEFEDKPHRTTPNMHRRPNVTVEFQEEREYKTSTFLTENNHTNNPLFRSQQRTQNNNCEQPVQLQKYEPREMKHQAEEKTQNGSKDKLQLEKRKGNASIPNRSSKALNSIDMKKKQSSIKKAAASRKISTEVNAVFQTKRSPGISNQKGKLGDAGYSFARRNMNNSNHRSANNSSKKDQESESVRADNCLAKEEKPIQIQAALKAKEEKVHTNEIPQKVSEVITRQSRSLRNLTRPLRHQNSSLQEIKEGRQEEFSSLKETSQSRTNRSKQAEACTIKSENSVSNIQSSNVSISQAQKEVKENPLLRTPGQDKSTSLNKLQNPAQTNSCQMTFLIDKNDQQTSGSVADGNETLKSYTVVPGMLLNDEARMDAGLVSLEQQKPPKPEIIESLTESENHLKKILIKSQLFLDTAEALLKLNIPLGSLQDGGRDYNQEDDNLILDCGYEMMKRIGRRQELSIHPFVNVPLSSNKVKSLDDLVKQLKNEFEKLKSYDRDDDKPLVEDYLPKMLERDVSYNDPDLNCMWDMGWNEQMFVFIEKDDVIRDVERYVLNRLVDEIARDLICI